MMRWAINELTTYRWSFEEDVIGYQEAGFSAIGVWREKLSDYGEEKGAELLAECGLKVSSLSWAGGFTGSDGRKYQESLEDAISAIRVAAMLKADCLILYSGPQAGHTKNHARRIFINALEDLVPHALQHKIPLAIKPMHPACARECTFATSIDAALSLIKQVDCPIVKFAFDTYHFGHQSAVIQKITDLIDHLAIIQLGDSREEPLAGQNRCPLGEGTIPLDKIMATFDTAGYNGYYEVKLIGEEFKAVDYCQVLGQTQRAINKLSVGR